MTGHPLWGLLPYLRAERRVVLRTVLVSYLSSAGLVALGVLAAYAVGTAVVDGRVLGWPWWVALVGVVAARAVLTWHEMDLSHDVAYRVLARLRVALFGGLARSTPARVGGRHSGDLAATAMGDIEKLEFFYAHTLAQMAAAVLLVATGALAAALVAPGLVLVVLAGSLALAACATVLARQARAAGEEAQEQAARLSTRVVEVLAGRREVLGYGLGSTVAGDVRRAGAAVAAPQARAAGYAAAAASLRDVLVVAAVLAAVGISADAAADGRLSAAWVAPVVAGTLGVLAPVADLAGVTTQLHQHRASARRVLAGVTAPGHLPEPTHPALLPDGPLGLRATGVAFGYGDAFALTDLDLDVAPGERVVLTGPSGVGKSTIAHLLTRWWDPLTGQVQLVGQDGTGVDLRDLPDTVLRPAVTLVGQDVHLFHGTLADNLRRAAPDADDDQVHQVLEQVGLSDVVAALPAGVQTVLGQRGSSLSGGQRARLALARALLLRPRVLVLDEHVAHLDPASEDRITAMVQGLPGDLTIVTVAHRAATIAASGRVVDVTGLGTSTTGHRPTAQAPDQG